MAAGRLPPLAFAALLVAWGNGAALLAGTALPAGWGGAALGLSLTALALAWARARGLSPRELGLDPARAPRAAAAGLALGLIAAAGALLVLRFPPLVGGPVIYAPVERAGTEALLVRALLTMPLDTVLPEEVAFRGALLGSLRRRLGDAAAVAWSAAAFAAWHAVIVRATLLETNLAADPLLLGLGAAGSALALLAGGAAFALLRLVSGSLAAPAGFHWAFNAALLLGLAARG